MIIFLLLEIITDVIGKIYLITFQIKKNLVFTKNKRNNLIFITFETKKIKKTEVM